MYVAVLDANIFTDKDHLLTDKNENKSLIEKRKREQ